MASIGDAIILLPIMVLVAVAGVYVFTEVGFSVYAEKRLGTEYYDFHGDCATYNGTDGFKVACKNNFGVMGWKQWVDQQDQEFIKKFLLELASKTAKGADMCGESGVASVDIDTRESDNSVESATVYCNYP